MGLLNREAAAKNVSGKFEPGKYVFKFLSFIKSDGQKIETDPETGEDVMVDRTPSYYAKKDENDKLVWNKETNKPETTDVVKEWVIVRAQIIQDGVAPISAGAFITLNDEAGLPSSKGHAQLESLFNAVGLSEAQQDKLDTENQFFRALENETFITRIMTDNELLKDDDGKAILDDNKKPQWVPKTRMWNDKEQIQYKLSGWFEEVSEENVEKAANENAKASAPKMQPLEVPKEDNPLGDLDDHFGNAAPVPEPVAPPAPKAAEVEDPFDFDFD